jgi:tight adherence protein B
MTPGIASLLTFLAVLMFVVSFGSLLSDVYTQKPKKLSRRLDEEFHRKQRDRVQKSVLFKDLHKLAAEPFGVDPDLPKSWKGKLEHLLEQSGLDWTTTQFVAMTVGGGISLSLLGLLRGSLLLALILAVVGASIPYIYVNTKRKMRLEALRKQLPEAYDLIARALRAGQTISQTMQGVADEFAQPIAGEFSYCYEQQNLGLPTEVALRDLARRTGLLEINIFVVAVIVQRQVGGNLAEMLEGLAALVRDRFRIRGIIQSLTAEGKMQAGILMGLPFVIFVAMLFMNRPYAMTLFDYPGLLIGIVVSMGLGALWIRKIINFDF